MTDEGRNMKKVAVFISVAVILISGIAGCKSTPAPSTNTQTATGIVKSVTAGTQAGTSNITIQTPAGQTQSFTIDTTSNVSLDGYVCPIEQVGQLVTTGNATYNCTITYDPTYHAIAAGVYQIVPTANTTK